MRWIESHWDNMEVIGLCLYSLGVGCGFGIIFGLSKYFKSTFIQFMFVVLALLMFIGLGFCLYGSKKAFDKYKEEMKNERI